MIGNHTGVSKKPRFFYGYWIVLVAFFCSFINGGSFYIFGLFVAPLQEEFGWSRGSIMVAATIFSLVPGLTAPIVGRIVDRHGAKMIMVIGALVCGLGFVVLSLVHTLWSFYVGYAIAGVGITAIGTVPTTAVIGNWFERRRGTAIGIMAAGMGAGGFTLSPFIGAYLIPNFGWKVAYFVFALISWMLLPLVILVLKAKPEDMGLWPDGKRPDAAALNVKARILIPATKGLTLKMALTTLTFWLIAFAFLANSFSQVGLIQHQVPYLVDIGFPLATAATVNGIVGLWSLIGRFVFGWLCDRIQVKYASAIGFAIRLAGIVILMNVRPTTPMLLWLYAIVLGFGVGGQVPTMSMLTSASLGMVAYGAIFGMITLIQSIGSSSGPLIAGYMYDATGSYKLILIIFLSLFAVAIPAVLAVRRSKVAVR